MNKNGNVAFYGLMLGLTLLVLALALAPAVTEFTGDAMNKTINGNQGLDCNNSSISNFDKATCLATDLNSFYFIGGLLFISGAVIAARFIF